MTLTQAVVQFLQGVPPFQTLSDAALEALARTVSLEYYPAGFPILTQGGPASDSLQVVLAGAAKVSMRSMEQEEIVIDYRSEGDAIGFLSLYGGDRSRVDVTAVKDTTCYLIPREPFMALLEAHPDVREYFHRVFLAKYMDKAFTDLRSRSGIFGGGGEKLLFTTAVGDLITRGAVTAPSATPIGEAAGTMSRHGISSLVLTDAGDAPVGIMTDRDLRDKVAARGRDTAEPVAGIMSTALIKAEASNYCFEALLTMLRHNIHHLLVVDNGRLKGIVTNHDLLILQGTSPISVVREIEGQTGLEGLAQAASKVNSIVGLLLRDGAKASNITRIITEINDRIVRKAIEIGLRELGPAPLPWCWLSFGSEGRREQTFRTDQDNALLWADPSTPAEEAAALAWFPAFTRHMRESLERCGFAPCPAGYMADTPRWRQPLSAWRELFSKWIATPGPEALLHAAIFFDFRGLGGTLSLAADLRAHVARATRNQRIFFARLAGAVTTHRPPLGIFGNIEVRTEGEHKDKLNLKVSALGPIIGIVRLCALERGIPETGTLDRIAALRDTHPLLKRFGDELASAFEFLSLLRIHHQFEQLQGDESVDNFVDPERLSRYEKKALKDAFRLINRVQELIVEEYRAGLVGS
jgi:CBS domain-containing protein